jgi:hypothetical protein
MKTKMTVWMVLILGVAACSRGPDFRKDAEYYHGESEKETSQRFEKFSQPKKRVIVMDFWNSTPVQQLELGAGAAELLRAWLEESQKIIIPQDSKLGLKTEDFVQGDDIRVEQLIREGRKRGVAVVLVGRLSKIVFRQKDNDVVGVLRQKLSVAAVDLEIKLFDIRSGREVWAKAKTGEASDKTFLLLAGASVESPEYRASLVKAATNDAVAKITQEVLSSIDKLSWEGHIAKIGGGKIYVSAGKASGLIAGDILKVLTQGDDVYDPKNGAYLGRSKGHLKGTLEVVDFIGPDSAVAEIHTGSNFQEGDVVYLY